MGWLINTSGSHTPRRDTHQFVATIFPSAITAIFRLAVAAGLTSTDVHINTAVVTERCVKIGVELEDPPILAKCC